VDATREPSHRRILANHIFDLDLRRRVCEILDAYRCPYLYLPFRQEAYERAKTPREKLCAAVPINYCRTLALQFGRSRFDYSRGMMRVAKGQVASRVGPGREGLAQRVPLCRTKSERRQSMPRLTFEDGVSRSFP
jgi:hypothetical protein